MIPVPDFTVGNTITVAIAIYKQNWKKYLKLSLIAHLWLLVPVYGWARYFAIAAWISKLSLNELTNDIDDLNRKQYFTIRSLFLFLSTGLISIFILIIIYYILGLLLGLVATLLQKLFNSPIVETLSNISAQGNGIAFWILTWSIMLIISLTSALSYARLFLTDLSFIENNIYKIFSLIYRSYSLTKNNKLKVFKIIWISFILSCSLYLSIYFFYYLISFIFNRIGFYNWDIFYYTIWSLYLIMLVCAQGIIFPFWQSIKAITFYQLTYSKKDWSLR